MVTPTLEAHVTTLIPQQDEHNLESAWRKRLRLSLLAGILAVVALMATACGAGSPSASTTVAPTDSAASSTSAAGAGSSTAAESTGSTAGGTTQSATKLEIKDLVVGKGATAKTGDPVTVDYTGWLMDGTKFDSSIDRNQPFAFTIGAGRVIEGWDKGVAGMKVGGTRQLIIPPAMGYGAQGAGGVIPPNATLKFEIKLLAVGSSAK
jgi:FKBP-type peptidyl-prolyl cis-trans isomerase FkpA